MVESPRCLPTLRSTTTAWPPGTRPTWPGTWPGSRLTPSQTRTPPWGRPPRRTCGRTSSPMRGRRTSSASERTMQRNMKGGHLHNFCLQSSVLQNILALSFQSFYNSVVQPLPILIYLFGILQRSSKNMNCNQRAYNMFYLNVCHFVICPVHPSDVTNQRNSPTPLVRRHSWLRTSLRRTSPNTDTLVPPKRWGSFRWVQTFHMNYVSPVGPKNVLRPALGFFGQIWLYDCLVYVSMKLGKKSKMKSQLNIVQNWLLR